MINKLNLPEYEFRFKNVLDKRYIFDEYRKKYVVLTPEEWVRQNFLKYLNVEKKYPKSLTGVEISLKINGLSKRADIVIYDSERKPDVVVECKAPTVKIDEKTCQQALLYNTSFSARLIILTNGIAHYCIVTDTENNNYTFIKTIPEYQN